MLRRELEIRQKLQGLQHPDLIPVLENYAAVLRRQGKYDRAELYSTHAAELRAQLKKQEK